MQSMNNKFVYTISFIIIIFILGFNSIDSELLTSFKNYDNGDSSKVYALKLPELIDFCGEQSPLDAPDIRERLDRELLVNTYWQSNMMLLLKRSNKWFPLIESILKEEGVPEDLSLIHISEPTRPY